MLDVKYVQLAFQKSFTFCKCFVRVCGWCMHLVCYRSVQSRILAVFFSILLPSKKEKNKFLLLSYFCKPWYDAIGKIYLSCHMFTCEHFFIEFYQKSNQNVCTVTVKGKRCRYFTVLNDECIFCSFVLQTYFYNCNMNTFFVHLQHDGAI